MRTRILIILLALTTFICHGQTFLTKYPKLTEKNLNECFSDWKSYSDSINSNNIITDSIIADIIMWNYTNLKLNDHPKYNVVPQEIEVERYYLDVDTVMAKHSFGFPDFEPEQIDDQYVVYNVTPPLPYRGLYLTPDIKNKLSSFAGGLKNGDKLEEINKTNVEQLKEYISVHYGHWGGYWWFTSFPIITHICYADNLIAVMRRTSWCDGDVIWYVKKNGQFVRQPDPVTTWIE